MPASFFLRNRDNTNNLYCHTSWTSVALTYTQMTVHMWLHFNHDNPARPESLLPITSPSLTTCLILWPRLASPPQTWFFSSLVPISVGRDLVPPCPRHLLAPPPSRGSAGCTLAASLFICGSGARAVRRSRSNYRGFQNEAPLKPMTFIKAVLRDRCLRRRWEGHLTGRLKKQPSPHRDRQPDYNHLAAPAWPSPSPPPPLPRPKTF